MPNARIRSAGIFFLVLIFISAATFSDAQDFSRVQIQTEKITGNIYVLSGGGGNVGVSAGNDGVFVIDASYAPLAERIKAAIAALGGTPARFVLNTHWHPDHTGGDEYFARAGAVMVAHENVRKRLSAPQFLAFFQKTIPPVPASARPIITFSRDITFHLNGDDIYVFHVEPAHTDGDAVIRFLKADVIHMGDLYFNGMYPFIDLDAGGSIDGMIAATDRILQLCDGKTKVIPGHGPVSNRAGLTAYRAMLLAIRDRVADEIREGKTLNAIIATRPTREYDPVWGQGFMKPELFVRIVHDSLIKEQKKRVRELLK
jgi:cyclase